MSMDRITTKAQDRELHLVKESAGQVKTALDALKRLEREIKETHDRLKHNLTEYPGSNIRHIGDAADRLSHRTAETQRRLLECMGRLGAEMEMQAADSVGRECFDDKLILNTKDHMMRDTGWLERHKLAEKFDRENRKVLKTAQAKLKKGDDLTELEAEIVAVYEAAVKDEQARQERLAENEKRKARNEKRRQRREAKRHEEASLSA